MNVFMVNMEENKYMKMISMKLFNEQQMKAAIDYFYVFIHYINFIL